MKRSYRTEDMKCDECGKVEIVHSISQDIPGWISVSQIIGKFVNSDNTGELCVDFCSWECAEKFCKKKLTEDKP